MKKTFNFVLLLLCVIVAISTMLSSCDSAYHKETDKMISQCEKSINRNNLTKSESDINVIKKTRELTQEQTEKLWQIESQISELKKQIEQERIEEQKKKAEQEKREKQKKEEEFVLKGWYYFRDNYLKAPSTASLYSYSVTDDGNLIISYDAQNGFGAMIRGRAMVFFKNGEPHFASGL